jgi:phosphate starvation-inducible membrane PsiE
MSEISKVYKGVLITDSLENYMDKEHVSLCQFLFFLNIADIAQYVKNNFYTDKTWHFKYDVEAMIKLVVRLSQNPSTSPQIRPFFHEFQDFSKKI